MRIRSPLLRSLSAVLMLGTSLSGQEVKPAHGLVTNEEGEPIAGVVVIGLPSGPIVTNEKGEFDLTQYDKPVTILYFSKEKFQTAAIKILVPVPNLRVILSSPAAPQTIPFCKSPAPGTKRVGNSSWGLKFDVPIAKATVKGGTDVDYTRILIEPKSGTGWLSLLFGSYASSPAPYGDLVTDSKRFWQRSAVTSDGKEIGLDSHGTKSNREVWRKLGIISEGAEYFAPPQNVELFDRIINSACFDRKEAHWLTSP